MKKYLSLSFQLAAVFIGTIVGAGLASGEEITLFFSRYGCKSFIGLLICMLIYVIMGFIIIHISTKYNLNSYNEFIRLVSPGFLGQVTDILTSIFLLSGSAIILAGSGALISQFFHVSKWIGIILMCCLSIYILLKDTEGLLEINSFIVPCLIIIITTIFILFIGLSKDIVNIPYIMNIADSKYNWFISTLLYAGFNIISCSGVLVPLSSEIKSKTPLKLGVLLGSIVLTVIAFMINLMLMLNIPNIFQYDIPLLYIADRFGKLIQILLLCVMWLEMFSTEVSDIYSLGKTIENVFNIPYKKSVILIILIAIPISQLGFVNLITYVYPAFGAISFVFIIQCIIFYFKQKSTN
ncbi:transporter [Clostridium sp. MB40-C1]|uniref:YkvI family membrane protein n=1 Tax=Clostridium sp. MB40-C1 TaxID=3070996 RepID=UPI0027DEB693|nr:transporter [Clostridium sp. MB40-C1]WMJ80236.1 transporter [Clostridium sp. MB40-C1]